MKQTVKCPEVRKRLAATMTDDTKPRTRGRGIAMKSWMSVIALVVLGSAAHAQALQPAEQRGLVFVKANCAKCHAIDKVSDSRSTSRRRSAPSTSATPSRHWKRHWPKES